MPFTEVFAGIAVQDRDAAIEFYERLLGAPPTMLPNEDEAAWQLTGGGWLYVLRDADRAGRAGVTLLVDDLDAARRGRRGRDRAQPGRNRRWQRAHYLDHRSRRQPRADRPAGLGSPDERPRSGIASDDELGCPRQESNLRHGLGRCLHRCFTAG